MAGNFRLSDRLVIWLHDDQKTAKAQELFSYLLDHDAVTILPFLAFGELIVIQMASRLFADRIEQRVLPADRPGTLAALLDQNRQPTAAKKESREPKKPLYSTITDQRRVISQLAPTIPLHLSRLL